jgi:hypothetical protein
MYVCENRLLPFGCEFRVPVRNTALVLPLFFFPFFVVQLMNCNVIMPVASEITVASYFAWLAESDVSFAPLQGADESSAAKRRSLLLLDDSAIDVTWEEVVYGRLVYEAFSRGPQVLSHFLRQVAPMVTTSLACIVRCPSLDKLIVHVRSWFDSLSDAGITREAMYQTHFCVAEMVLGIFYHRRPPLIGLPLIFTHRCGFVVDFFLLKRGLRIWEDIPPYTELVSRWVLACGAIGNDSPFTGRLTHSEGSAWQRQSSRPSSSHHLAPPEHSIAHIGPITMMTAKDAFAASAPFANDLRDYFNEQYLDVHAHLTELVSDIVPPQPIEVSCTDVSIDVEHGVSGRVLVIGGSTFSPGYREHMLSCFNDLTFALSPPSDKRLIRIAGHPEGLFFILGSHLIEGCGLSGIEDEILCMCKEFMKHLTPYLREHANNSNLVHNPDLEYNADLVQFTLASPTASAYALHNDVNVLICDNGTDDLRYPAEQVVVVTLVIGDDWPPCVKVYLAFFKEGEKDPVAKLPIPKDAWHIQLHNMQLLKHQVIVDVPNGVSVSPHFRAVLSLRLTARFQQTADELETRLLNSPLPLPNQRHYVRVASDYDRCGVFDSWPDWNKISDLHKSPPSLVPVPVNVMNVVNRIRLPPDTFPRHPSTHWSSDISKTFTSSFTIAVAGPTWKHLVSAPYMEALIEKGFFILVADPPHSAGTSVDKYDFTYFGPCVDRLEEHGGVARETLPGTLVRAESVSKRFHLSTTIRHQATWNHKDHHLNAIYITNLYRNDVPNLANAIRYALKLSDAPQTPPGFWVGGTGGGAKSAGELGCADLGSRKADKAAPHAHVPCGQSLSSPNSSLVSASLRQGVVQVYVRLDPDDPSLVGLLKLPPAFFSAFEETKAVYLGLYQLGDVSIACDQSLAIQETLLGQFRLGPKKEKYGRFREEPHFKFHLAPLRVSHPPADSQPMQLLPLIVHRDDARLLSIVVSSSDSGPTQRSTIIDYLNPRDSRCVSRHDVLQSFLDDRGWERFSGDIVGDDGSDHTGSVLPSISTAYQSAGKHVSPDLALEAVKQASVATFYRLLCANVDSVGRVGFLSGSIYSCLSSVFRIHPMHHPVRTYDVTTLFFQACMQNANVRLDRHFSPADVGAPAMLEKALLASILLRLTGRVQAFCEWYTWHLSHSPSPGCAHSPIHLPSVDEMPSFLKFLKFSCMDASGYCSSMACWTSMQFACSIPGQCRNARSFIVFVNAMLHSLPMTVTNLLSTASMAASQGAPVSPALGDTRETARCFIKSLIIGPLPTDDRSGINFISRQVVLDLEEVWDLPFGPPLVVNPGFGGKQGFRLLARSSDTSSGHDPSPTACANLLYSAIVDRWSAVDLSLLGLQKSVVDGHVSVIYNSRPFTLEDTEHLACGGLYSPVAMTLPNRHCSVPKPASPHCHPIPRFADDGVLGPISHAELRRIALSAVNAWHGTLTVNPVALADVFVLRDDVSIKCALDAGPTLASQTESVSIFPIDFDCLSPANDDLLSIPDAGGKLARSSVLFDTSSDESDESSVLSRSPTRTLPIPKRRRRNCYDSDYCLSSSDRSISD